MALARDCLTTSGPGRAVFVVHHVLEAAKAVDFPMQTFGGTKNFLPQALAAWEERAEAEEARSEADARVDAQRRHEREERERRRRLADMRAALADEAPAAGGVDRTRLGYDVLVKIKMEELLEQQCVRMPMSADGAHRPAEVTARR